MIQDIINAVTLIAFFAISIDIIMQIIHIYKRKSSMDLSLKGCFIRLLAGVIFTIKFYSTKDIYLIIGQTIFVMSYLVYFVMLIYYRK